MITIRYEKPSHISTLAIKDFKSLKNVSVDLAQVNVFVGANGSGKSNLLEAIGVLGSCASGIVDDASLLRRGVRPGVPALYKSSFRGHRLAPKILLQAESTRGAAYRAYISNPPNDPRPRWVFGNEELRGEGGAVASRGPQPKAKLLGAMIPLANDRSVVTLARAHADVPIPVLRFLDALEDFAIFAPVTPVLRGIAPDTSPRAPVGLYGGQLAEAIASIQEDAREQSFDPLNAAYELIDWADGVIAAAPSREILSPSVPTTRVVVEFQDRFMAQRRNTLSGYDASEGALYILYMMVLASHRESPSIFAVDNFDSALNPRTARALTRAFVSNVLLHDRQVFLTTHNPLVLDGLDLADSRIRLFTVSRASDGPTRIDRVPVRDVKSLKEKHGEFAVSDLWITGRLGGMPNV